MSFFATLALLLTLAAAFSYVNHRFIGLPTTIGVMLIALVTSLALVGLGMLGLGVYGWAERLLTVIDFSEAVMQGMLGFILFAAAMRIDVGALAQHRWFIILLDTVGVVASTFIVGILLWLALGWIGLGLPFLYALLFGALIAPTDPAAVPDILKTVGAPKRLETNMVGESLFNDCGGRRVHRRH